MVYIDRLTKTTEGSTPVSVLQSQVSHFEVIVRKKLRRKVKKNNDKDEKAAQKRGVYEEEEVNHIRIGSIYGT